MALADGWRGEMSVAADRLPGMTEPMDDAGQIAAALRGTTLDGLPVEEGLGGTFLVGDVDPGRVHEAWQAARSVMPRTGRWPVFTLPGGLHREPDEQELQELDRAARGVDPWSVYRRSTGDDPCGPAEVESYVHSSLGSEMVAPALKELRPPTTMKALQWWIYRTMLTDRSQGARPPDLSWTVTWPTMPKVQLVLLPTTVQWLAPAWVPYFGAARENGHPAWAAAMWQWEQQWGAGLVASWDTVLEFVRQRRPAPGPQAWKLAGQLLAIGGNLECQQWQLALALTRSDRWYLFDRP
jgi:hypothetical protein